MGRTMPCPRYVRFHEAHVQRYLSRLKAFPPRCGRASSLYLKSGFRMRNKATSCRSLMVAVSMTCEKHKCLDPSSFCAQ